MPTHQESIQNTAATARDELASGPPNRIRRSALQMAEWLFRPPYLPSALVWLLAALIASNITLELLPQPASYWIDPSSSQYYSFFGTPLSWGVGHLALMLGYLFLVVVSLHLINVQPALALWMGLSLYHLVSIPDSFRCTGVFFLPFETVENCSAVHDGVIVLAGVTASLFMWLAVRLHLIPGIQHQASGATWGGMQLRNIKYASLSWIGLCTAAVLFTVVFAPKPNWETMTVEHVPPARTEAALAYDTGRGVAVLFAGTSSWTQTNGWQSLTDTWEWTGTDWIEMHPAHSPAPRYSAAMAFDEKRGVTVLFGGIQAGAGGESLFFDDTWEWDGSDWREASPAKRPPARQDAVMFFDPTRGTTVIYGGYYVDRQNQATVFLDDAWEWDGTTWQEREFDQRRRNSASATVFDPLSQTPLLMDAEGLWSWQGLHWTPLGFAHNPPGRWGAQLVFNPERQQVVLFGGFKDKDVFNDAWLYDGEGWEELVTKIRPPHRNGHVMFYDQVRDTVVLFGGLNGGTVYGDMWELVQP